VVGTIGVLDRLLREGHVSRAEYARCISALLDAGGEFLFYSYAIKDGLLQWC
jgi:hypothetical protein